MNGVVESPTCRKIIIMWGCGDDVLVCSCLKAVRCRNEGFLNFWFLFGGFCVRVV